MVQLNNDWDKLLGDEFKKDYYLKLRAFLKNEYSTKVVYPDMNKIFDALRHVPHEDVKIVLLGQDPYHGPNQAHGLSFSVNEGIAFPKSLINIFKELNDDVGVPIPTSGYLAPWAKQGVLLLNTVLTVRGGEPFSHRDMGWEIFTTKVIELLSERSSPVIFMLWGKPAGEKAALIDRDKHYILTAAHPSPFAAHKGFFGCKHFSKANEILISLGKEPIDWTLPTT